jgi:hypothetical protein
MPGTPCWEYQKCTVKEECPAYPSGGHTCWNVEGTLCRGQRQGGYEEKVGACRVTCAFYNGVMTGAVRIT